MRAASTIIIVIAANLLAACAREKSPPPASSSAQGAAPLVQVHKVGSFQAALALTTSTSLTCADPASCPPHVGLYLAADREGGFAPDSDSVAACTAVLVGADLALTNSHCIPSAVKLLPDLCAERVRVVLPEAGGFPEETLSCAALLGHSERATNVSPDLALIRLKTKTARPPSLLRRTGLEDKASLLSAKVDPDLKHRSGVLRTERCVSAARSYRMPIYQGPSSPAVVAGDCSAIAGNSGSPLFDSEGKLAALMQAALPISEASRQAWGEHLERREEGFAPLALATSLICLGSAPPAWDWNPACGTVTEEDVARARPRIRQLLGSPGLEERVESLLAPLRTSPLVSWQRMDIETRPLRRRESFTPACLQPASAWAAEYSDGETLRDSAEIELSLASYSLELRFNRFLQPATPAVQLNSLERRKYSFSPRKAAAENLLELAPVGEGEPLRLTACSFSPASDDDN